MQVHVKVVHELPLQGRQPLEGRAKVAVLVHPLDRALEDDGGQAEDLAVEVQTQAEGVVRVGTEISALLLLVSRQVVLGVRSRCMRGWPMACQVSPW